MGKCLVTNNAAGTLASDINNSAVTIVLTAGNGALFPNPTGGDFFFGTLVDPSNNKEIVKVTARSTDTLTVVRAQDGTSARAFLATHRFELRDCAGVHNTYAQLATPQTLTGNQTIVGDVLVTGAAASSRKLHVQTAGVERWTLEADAVAEGGSNAGSNLKLKSYDDTGTLLQTALSIVRATGVASVLAGFGIGSDVADHFPSGVQIPMRQSAVPTGWTKDTTFNDAAFRVVSGTPSSRVTAGKEFTTLMAARTIARANLPNFTLGTDSPGNHTHFEYVAGTAGSTNAVGGSNSPASALVSNSPLDYVASAIIGTPNVGLTSPAGAHTHTTDSINGNTTQTTMPFDINYVDLYIATKN